MEQKGLKLILDMDMEKFNSAINNIRNKTNAFNNDINKLKQSLKFDGGNVEQYTALVEKLRAKYNQTEVAIKDLKQILDASLETGKITKDSSEWVNLTNKIITLEKNLQITGRNIEEVNRDWQQNGKVGKDTLNGLNRELQEHKSIWDKMGDSTNVFFGNLKANLVSGVITGGLDLIKNAISGIINGLKTLGKGYFDLLKTGVEYNAKLQDYTKSLGIILGGDEETAKRIVKDLKSASGQLGFDVEPLVQGAQRLVLAGVGIDDAKDSIVGMIQALRLAGADNGALDLVITNLMQLQTQGKATSRDLREFATKGLPIYDMLAKYSERFAEGMYQASDVHFEDILGALQKATSDPNSPWSLSSVIAKETISGQLGIIEQQWLQLLGAFSEDTTSVLQKDILPTISGFLQSMTEAFDENGWEGVKEAFASGLSSVINVLFSEETINAVLGGVEAIVDAFEDAFNEETEEGRRNKEVLSAAIDRLLKILSALIEKVKPQLITIGKTIGGAIIDGIKEELVKFLTPKGMKKYGYTLFGDYVGEDFFNSGGYGNLSSLGYGNLASGGFGMKSGGNSITLNASFNVDGQLNEQEALRLADVMTDRINQNIGRLV